MAIPKSTKSKAISAQPINIEDKSLAIPDAFEISAPTIDNLLDRLKIEETKLSTFRARTDDHIITEIRRKVIDKKGGKEFFKNLFVIHYLNSDEGCSEEKLEKKWRWIKELRLFIDGKTLNTSPIIYNNAFRLEHNKKENKENDSKMAQVFDAFKYSHLSPDEFVDMYHKLFSYWNYDQLKVCLLNYPGFIDQNFIDLLRVAYSWNLSFLASNLKVAWNLSFLEKNWTYFVSEEKHFNIITENPMVFYYDNFYDCKSFFDAKAKVYKYNYGYFSGDSIKSKLILNAKQLKSLSYLITQDQNEIKQDLITYNLLTMLNNQNAPLDWDFFFFIMEKLDWDYDKIEPYVFVYQKVFKPRLNDYIVNSLMPLCFY